MVLTQPVPAMIPVRSFLPRFQTTMVLTQLLETASRGA